MKKIFIILMALGASISLWAGNTIIYTASAKLDEKTTSFTSGININAFGVSITSHTFANDTGIVTFSGDVTSIGRDAFSESRNLTSITIPDGVTSIGYRAFYDCSGLTSLEIPISVTSIETVAFAGCENLTSLTIPEGVTSIESQTFQNCYALTSLTIPNSVTSIEMMAFYNCTALASITLPDSLTSIGLGAFSGCSALTSLTIPSSVTNLGMMILVGCSGLTSITAEGVNPPVCESACFSDVDTSIPLYVPSGSVTAYQSAEGWQDFTNILPIVSIATEVSVATAAPESNLRKDLFQGKVYITRDGHTYTILGTRVK